jgi:hypothetical protein
MIVEQVIAENQRGSASRDEIRSDYEGLREAVGARLLNVAEFDAPTRAVTESAAETAVGPAEWR